MDPSSSAAAAPAPDAPQVPSFMDQMRAAETPPPAPSGDTPPPTQAPAADAPPAWLQELGGAYKSPDEVKQALASLDTLRQNQLTDDHKVGLQLLSDPAASREYLELLHADYSQQDDEAILRQQFKAERPGMTDAVLDRLFHREQDAKFPGLANDEADEDHQADKANRKLEADRVRAQLGTTREQRLAEIKKAALQGEGPGKQDLQALRDTHLNTVKTLFEKGADGFKLTVDVGGKPLNLAVEAADLPAIQAIMENPYAAFAKEDGTPNYDEIQQYALLKTQLPKFLALAQQAALEGRGPAIALGELHNDGGAAGSARPTDGTPSFMEQMNAAGNGQPASRKPRY